MKYALSARLNSIFVARPLFLLRRREDYSFYFQVESPKVIHSPSSLFFIFFFFLLRTNRKRSEIPTANAFLNPGKLLWSGTLRELTFVPVLLFLIRVETAPMEERRWRFS